MRIPPFFLETVAFVCVESAAKGINEPNIAGGTAFFVTVPDEVAEGCLYVVTARHCVEEIAARTVYLRIPTITGASQFGYSDLLTNKDDWFRHDDADVALIPLDLREAQVDYRFKAIPRDAFVG